MPKTVLLCSKEILRKMKFDQEKCEIDTFQTGFCDTSSFDNINY